jgi:glutamine amidotransferase PdxT
VVARHRAAVPDLDGSVVPGRHSTAQAIMDARRELLARLQEVQQQAPP